MAIVMVLTDLLFSVVICATVWVFISILAALDSLSVKDIFSKRLFLEIWSNLAGTWSVKTAFILVIVSAILVFPCVFDAARRIQDEENGECTCRCKKCKATSEQVEAIIRYLDLDDEDLYGVKEDE